MLHDLIIWPKAAGFAGKILDDLRASFNVLSRISIIWDEDRLYDNFRVFYSKSWQRFPSSKLKKAIEDKAEYCGCGEFLLIVFDDDFPEMGYEQTNDGRSVVNMRVFDKKKKYRALTGGGHLVHTSNNAAETDRDLTLLLGFGKEDFLKEYGKSGPEGIRVRRNCTGLDGYESLCSFFYTLNHTIDYVVLRNFECLPDHFCEEGHDDIDLLVDNLSYVVNLTSAKPISGMQNRVDYSISIGGEDVQFDFRYVGDNYYDIAWEKRILENRALERGLFFIPGREDLYYSLLYHAYVQKVQVKPDYLSKLVQYGKEAGVAFSSNIRNTIHQLDEYMMGFGYEYIAPVDKTVVYNHEALKMSDYALRNGECIKHTEESGNNGFVYSSKVFSEDCAMIKTGTSWLIQNEASFLERLSSYSFFPSVISKKELDGGEARLDLSKFEGVSFDRFFKNVSNQRAGLLRSFVIQMVDILRILDANGIKHRDISPSNLMIRRDQRKVKVGLIDFGWAAGVDDAEAKTPVDLGGRYSDGDNHSDSYAVGVILMEYWPDLFCMRLLASSLFRMAHDDAGKSLKMAKFLSRLPLGMYDRFRLLLRRHQRLSMIWHRLRK